MAGFTVDANTGLVRIARGDRQGIRFTVVDENGAVIDVSLNSFKFTVKRSIDDAITAAKFQKTSPLANGIDLTLAATGIVDVLIAQVDTASLSGKHVYDLKMTEPAKDPQTIAGPAAFFVFKDVTDIGVPPTPPALVAPFVSISISDSRYIQDQVDNLWYKYQHRNGTMVVVDVQVGPPPF